MLRPAQCRRLAGTLGVLGLLASPALADEARVDLEGSWFVVVHYRDWMTANPDADRWEDKVWTFERKGSRLQWTEYPIVVFEDDSGRFGRVGLNARARLLRKWEPNEAQQAEIAAGPRVNSRGSKTKSLRGSPERGWASSSATRTASAFTVGYQETWSIEDPGGRPVFTRDDALGTEADLATGDDDVLSGRTRYTTLQVLDGGDVLQGRYVRDENKQGSFRMVRAGAVRGLDSDDGGVQERLRAKVQATATRDVAYMRFLQALGDERVSRLRAAVGEEQLSAIWQQYEKRIIGQDPSAAPELAGALGDAYWSAVEQDFRELSDAEVQALLDGRDVGSSDPARVELLRDVRETIGEDELAALRARSVRAGEPGVREALREAYAEALRRELRIRLDPELP